MENGKIKKNKWENSYTEDLFRAVLTLKNKDEAKHFLRDLMTERELIEFGNRLRAAKMLKESIHYSAIVEATGLSSRTIARVKKWLKGNGGGYRLVLARLEK